MWDFRGLLAVAASCATRSRLCVLHGRLVNCASLEAALFFERRFMASLAASFACVLTSTFWRFWRHTWKRLGSHLLGRSGLRPRSSPTRFI